MEQGVKNPKVAFFFDKAEKWHDEYEKLRDIVLGCGLSEDLKWGCPCYALNGHNVVLIHGFKDYCALLFMKGALLKDPKNILIQQTENVQSARQIRFTSLEAVTRLATTVEAYIHEAIAVEKAGLKVEMKKTAQFAMPEEFRVRLEEDLDLKTAFEALTPGRQKGYLLHFSAAKQAKTREARVEKAIPDIFAGKGLDD